MGNDRFEADSSRKNLSVCSHFLILTPILSMILTWIQMTVTGGNTSRKAEKMILTLILPLIEQFFLTKNFFVSQIGQTSHFVSFIF